MSQPLVKCKRVFQALIKLAVEELCETADSLIAPVRLGVARPTAPFTLASSTIDVINVSKSVTLFATMKFLLPVTCDKNRHIIKYMKLIY